MSRIEGHTPEGRAMGESGGGVKAWLTDGLEKAFHEMSHFQVPKK